MFLLFILILCLTSPAFAMENNQWLQDQPQEWPPEQLLIESNKLELEQMKFRLYFIYDEAEQVEKNLEKHAKLFDPNNLTIMRNLLTTIKDRVNFYFRKTKAYDIQRFIDHYSKEYVPQLKNTIIHMKNCIVRDQNNSLKELIKIESYLEKG